MMNSNPWDDVGYKIQIVCLILAPSFLAAGIYLTLKHIIMHLGPEYSRLRPKYYTWIFISCDALSIVIQAVGGGIAASSDGSGADTGGDIMVVGIAIQVATMYVDRMSHFLLELADIESQEHLRSTRARFRLGGVQGSKEETCQRCRFRFRNFLL